MPRLFAAIAAAAFTLTLAGAAPADDTRTVVILARHAEKASQTDADPILSAAGSARAQALSDALADAGVDAVITTELQRTRLTAQPLLDRRHLTPETVRTERSLESHARAVAAAVRKHTGEVVLVVGHSNSIPAIIGALDGPKMPEICDSEYSNLYVVVLGAPGGTRLIRSRFGAADTGPTCPPR